MEVVTLKDAVFYIAIISTFLKSFQNILLHKNEGTHRAAYTSKRRSQRLVGWQCGIVDQAQLPTLPSRKATANNQLPRICVPGLED